MSIAEARTTDRETVESRLERLERENRLQRRLLLCLGFGLAGVVAFGTPLVRVPQELAARRIVLKDDQGRTRAVLGQDGEGVAALTFQDEKGKDQVLLGAGPRHASRLEFREGQTTRASLWSGSTGTSALSFFDPQESNSTSLYLRHDQDMGLSMRKGYQRYELGMRADGTLAVDGPTAETVTIRQQAPRNALGGRRRPRPLPVEDAASPSPAGRTISTIAPGMGPLDPQCIFMLP